MKKIKYFGITFKMGTRESTIVSREIIIPDSELDEQLKIINTSYSKYGNVTVEDYASVEGKSDRLGEIENVINNFILQI